MSLRKVDSTATVQKPLKGEQQKQSESKGRKKTPPEKTDEAFPINASQLPTNSFGSQKHQQLMENRERSAEPIEESVIKSETDSKHSFPFAQQDQVSGKSSSKSAQPVAAPSDDTEGAAEASVPGEDQEEAVKVDDIENAALVAAAAINARRTRPVSARPPPPKQKAPKAISEQVISREVTKIITDGVKPDEDDEEFTVKVVENESKENISSMENLSTEQHGNI